MITIANIKQAIMEDYKANGIASAKEAVHGLYLLKILTTDDVVDLITTINDIEYGTVAD